MTHLPPDDKTNPEIQLRTSKLRIGSRLLDDAYIDDGSVLLRAGQCVTSRQQLDRLLQPDVRFGANRSSQMPLDMENEAEMDTMATLRKLDFSVSDESLAKATALKNEAVEDVSDVFKRIDSTGAVDVPTAKNAVTLLIGELVQNPGSLLSLVRLKDTDAYTYTHSVNVSILAMYIAMATKYEKYIEEIGTGALLHDIGKINIPTKVLRKNGPLNKEEFDLIQQHPKQGAILLVKSGHEEGISLSCVLDHHEKITGSGYPLGKKQSTISPYAKITSIADIYDALTTDRPYRNAMSPQTALQLMTMRMGHELDPEILSSFIAAVGFFSRATVPHPAPTPEPQHRPIRTIPTPIIQIAKTDARLDFRA